jgi:hypothetical protein
VSHVWHLCRACRFSEHCQADQKVSLMFLATASAVQHAHTCASRPAHVLMCKLESAPVC